ncbi:MAG: Rieske 2Fe-2S domain-containing protein [Vicinamibacterales bacterium]
MKKYSKDQIAARLRSEGGLVFSEFTLVHEGDYDVSDADWNYKDVPHLHHVHELAEAIPVVVGDDMIATINLQKALGLWFPLSLMNFESGENSQTYYTTWLFYVLIIQSVYEPIDARRTRVSTTYCVGSPPLLRWTFPIIRRVLSKNYENLMSTDIPMRERRGRLRSWGYQFHVDGGRHSFVKTMDITKPHVIPPATSAPAGPNRLVIDDALPKDGEYLIGRDDHLGLRVVRSGGQLALFPRMCPHEGASLDGQPCSSGKIRCPWHGRIFEPIGRFDLSHAGEQTARTPQCTISLGSGVLTVAPGPD